MTPGNTFLFGLLFLCSCSTVKPYYSDTAYTLPDLPGEEIAKQVVLVGDAGEMQQDDPIRKPVMEHLSKVPEEKGAIIFLGDNIYTYGLPETTAEDYPEKVAILENQMKIAEGYQGRVLFIPGNHDWKKSSEGGWETLLRQEDYVNTFFKNRTAFLPSGGCPGPVSELLSDDLLLIVLDTNWWLQKYEKPGTEACSFGSPARLTEELRRIIDENPDKQILVAGHHPIISNGEHGGYFSFTDHIFPLRNVKPWLYLPLPVIGSIYPIARHAGVSNQDIPNKEFQQQRDSLRAAFNGHPGLIYVSGHEHNLQLHKEDQYYQVISGAGSKTNYARKGLGASYVQQKQGFARLLYYVDGEVWVEFFTLDKKTGESTPTYRQKLFTSG
jgi:predicted phosphodiesterase